MTESISIPPFNRNAILSFILAITTLLALCAGILPIPFTIIICYPPGVLFAIASLFLGLKSQRELRTDGKRGRSLAVMAVWVSGLSMLAYACMITAGVILIPRITEYVSQFISSIK
ncbi:MAG: hypothetical protein IPP66_11320 [Anaerolineales bacterium]|nr:hypothetical protein [Anaerolineales bacterium]